MPAAEHDITGLLLAWRQGDGGALDRLFPLVYEEIRRLAHCQLGRERPDHTLGTTGLIQTLAGGAILRACFFTRLAGNFEGASELVRVSRLRNANGWLLTGSSTEQGVSAKARCVT